MGVKAGPLLSELILVSLFRRKADLSRPFIGIEEVASKGTLRLVPSLWNGEGWRKSLANTIT